MKVHSNLSVWLWSVMMALLASRGGSEPASDGFTLTSSVTEIVPSMTDKAVMNCSFRKQEHPDVWMLTSLTLKQREINKTDYQDLLMISDDTQLTRLAPIVGVTDGSFDKTGESFLSITWPHPSGNVAGKYQCSAQTFQVSSLSETVSVDIELKLRKVELPDLIKALRELKDVNTRQDREIQNLTARVEGKKSGTGMHFLSGIFVNSSVVVDGHPIYWTVDTGFEFQEAKKMCSKFGGKLVESDFGKLQAVKPQFKAAGMAETDYWTGFIKRSGRWVYASTGASAGRISLEPRARQAPDDCASFLFAYNRGFDPDDCSEHKPALCALNV